jgi:hypothetical protein
MKRKGRTWLAMAALLLTGACYHQIVQTGAPAGSTVVDKQFVPGWLWGLVANNEVDVRRECPMGVAVVETEQSFVNGLVAAVTLGIYTPQHVRITCASRSAMLPSNIRQIQVPAGATKEAEAALVREAIELSAENHTPVALRY